MQPIATASTALRHMRAKATMMEDGRDLVEGSAERTYAISAFVRWF
jgi:hypothetical protein